jgi:hypothetical protein
MYLNIQAVQDDIQAEEIILGIKAEEAERDRLIEDCQKMIEKYENKILDYQEMCERSTKDARLLLGEYCRLRASKSTKTQQTYKLPSGTLKWLRKASRPVRDDSKLLDWIKIVAPQYVRVKTEEKPAWDELKKSLIECGDHYEYAIPDGELVPVEGVVLEPQEDVFEIK